MEGTIGDGHCDGWPVLALVESSNLEKSQSKAHANNLNDWELLGLKKKKNFRN